MNNEDRTPNTVSGIIHELKNLTIISPSTSCVYLMRGREIDEEILGNCTEKSTEHTSLNMRTNHQLNVKTSNEEL